VPECRFGLLALGKIAFLDRAGEDEYVDVRVPQFVQDAVEGVRAVFGHERTVNDDLPFRRQHILGKSGIKGAFIIEVLDNLVLAGNPVVILVSDVETVVLG